MNLMLGLIDEKVKENDVVDWSSNKIGGFPDWMITTGKQSVQPKCQKCLKFMYLLVQLYCPLQNSEYHRTIYVFGCTGRGCRNQAESFAVLRCQQKEKRSTPALTKPSTDDWGTNDWLDDVNEDEVNDKEKEKDAACEFGDISLDEVITKMNVELNISTTTDEKALSFNSYHIYAMKEIDIKEDDSYAMQLFREYTDREGSIDTSSDKQNTKGGGGGGGEIYEKQCVKHGDKDFHRFMKTVKKCPEQILRYDWKGEPLLFSNKTKISPSLVDIPLCSYCGSERTFEMQFMPQLAQSLHRKNSKKGISNGDFDMSDIFVDFSCLYIFTCSNSCWRDDVDIILTEVVAVQVDPETAKLSEIELIS